MHLLHAIIKKIKARPELAALVLIGFYLRIKGTNPGYFAHGDELMYGEAVLMILNKTLGMEPQVLGYYPPLVAWIMLIGFILIYIPLTIITQLPKLAINLIDYGSIFADQNAMYFFKNYILGQNWANAVYWGRHITVIFSTGTIILTYYLTLKIFKKRPVAFLAGLFVVVNYRLVLNSKIGFLDIYNVFFVLATFLSILSLYEKPTLKKYLTTWIIIGLSFLVKYQTYVIPAFMLVHVLISLKQSNRRIKMFISIFFSKGFVTGGVIAFLMVIISHYYHFQHWEKVRGMYEYQALKYGLGVNNLSIFPISYIYHIMLGPILTVTGIVGLISGFLNKKYRVATLILSSLLAPTFFLYFYYSTGGTYTRNLLVILPILLIFSAHFFTCFWTRLQNGLKNTHFKIVTLIALTIIILVSVKDQTYNAITASNKLSETSARILVEKWIANNISPGNTIGTYFSSFSPKERDFSIKSFSGVNEALSLKELEAENIEYAIIDFSMVSGPLIWWMGQPTDIGLKFWNKPDNLLSQSFNALAARELLWQSTVKAYLPKWQIPGYDYAIVKIAKNQSLLQYNLITQYSFEKDAQKWIKLNYFKDTASLLLRSSLGKNNPGSLAISKEEIKTDRIKRILTRPGMLRWESPSTKAKELFSYKLEAWVRAEEKVEKVDRNGFLRLDFYEANTEQSIESRPVISFVSERYFGNGEWKKLEVQGVAPKGTRYIRMGFQTDQAQNNYYMDNVILYQSNSIINEKQMEYLMIDDDDLFPPNDGGFL